MIITTNTWQPLGKVGRHGGHALPRHAKRDASGCFAIEWQKKRASAHGMRADCPRGLRPRCGVPLPRKNAAVRLIKIQLPGKIAGVRRGMR